MSHDATAVTDGADLRDLSLWPVGANPFADQWNRIKPTLADDPDWTFWLRWYQSVLDGTPMPPALIHDIALIAQEVWKAGPKEVAKQIKKIEEDHSTSDPTDIQTQLDRLPPPNSELVPVVHMAMQQNLRELPPTFDALESLILLEIERLKNKNYRDDDDREDCLRQISVFLSMYAAVVRMRDVLPVQTPVTDEQAEETLSLWQLYKSKLSALPREKADEVAEGAWDTGKAAVKFGLISGSTYLATLLQVPPAVGLSASALLFAPKQAGDIIKSAKDMVLPKSG